MQKFSYKYYKFLLEEAIKHGYVVSSFRDYNEKNSNTLILRHDVDYTLNGVLEMARIEYELGCTSSFLFRVHADEYNLFTCVAILLVRELLGMGHEIGLHFEAMNVGRALEINPEVLLKREKLVIESILDLPVITCSEHRELSGQIHGTQIFEKNYDPYQAGFKFYAMDKRFCNEMKYISDSNANWREGDPLEHYGRHQRMQVLIHPDWWFEKDLLLKGPYIHPRGI